VTKILGGDSLIHNKTKDPETNRGSPQRRAPLVRVRHNPSLLYTKIGCGFSFFLLVVPQSLQKKFRFWVHVFYNWQGLSCGIAIFHFSNYNSPHCFHLPLQFCLAFFFFCFACHLICVLEWVLCFFFRLLGKKWQIRYEVVRFSCLCNKAEFMMRSMFLQGQHKWSLQFCVSLGFWSIYTRCCMFENLCFVYLEWFTNIYFNFLHCLRFHFWKVIMAIVIPFTHASIQVILCFHFCVVFFV